MGINFVVDRIKINEMNSNLNRMDVQSVSSVIYQWIFLSGGGKKKNKESSVYLFDLFFFF